MFLPFFHFPLEKSSFYNCSLFVLFPAYYAWFVLIFLLVFLPRSVYVCFVSYLFCYTRFSIHLCSFYNCSSVCFIFYSLHRCFTFMSFLSLGALSREIVCRAFRSTEIEDNTFLVHFSTFISREVQANRRTKLPYTIRGTRVIDFLLRLTLFLLKMGYLYEIVFDALLFRLR